VGTSGFISIEPDSKTRYKHIRKIEIAAATGTRERDRLIQWDLIEVTFFCDGQGYFETFSSPCLPRVATVQTKSRRAAQAEEEIKERGFQQFVEICPNDDHVTRVHVRGQVTLRANSTNGARTELNADDLRGKVLVFTDLSRREHIELSNP
jgi:hypothetical protein